MRVATWNVNGLRARLDFLLHWLGARRPDIVGLQELKLTDDQFPHDEIEEAGYYASVYGQKAWNGVAVLSHDPASVSLKGLPGQEGLGARLLTTDIGDLSFTTVYTPNGKHVGHDDFPKKLDWLDGLHDYLDASHSAEKPVILCGDFNVCPTPLDSWNEDQLAGTIFHTDEERARFQRLLGWGLHDVVREREPGTRSFSWWDYRGGAFHRNQGLRIDFVLATAAVMKRVRAVEIDRDYRKKKEGLTPSDHAPVIVDLE